MTWINFEQARRLTGRSRRTLYYWVASGRVPSKGTGFARKLDLAAVIVMAGGPACVKERT